MTPKTQNLIQVNVAVMIWGITAMFAKGIALPVGDLIGIRSIFAAASLFLFIKIQGKSLALMSRRHFGLVVAIGFCLTMHWLTYFHALKISSAAVVILALHTYPIITALIEPMLFKEKLQKADIALAFGAFISVFIMMPEINLSNKTTQGILIGILSGLFFMSRNLMLRKIAKSYSSSNLMFWQTTVASIVLLPILFTSGEAPYSSKSLLLLLLLGTAFTALPQTLFASGLKNLSAKTVGILASFLPVYGAIFGYLIHNETVAPRTAIGGFFILLCVVYENTKQARRPKPNQSSPS